MSTTPDLESLMSARRADLEQPNGAGAPSAKGEPAEVEVIPPANPATGEILPAAVPASAPAGPVVPADPEPQFPMIPPKVLGGLPYARSYMKLALTIHQTELVPKAFRERPDAIMAAMMYGYELGLGPMQALNGLHVIDGKVGQDAELMRALIVEAGHLFVLQQGMDDDGEAWARVFCRRSDWPEEIPTAEFSWNIGRGRRAGLVEWYEKWTRTEAGRNRKLTWNPYSDDERPAWMDNGSAPEHKTSTAWQNYPEAMCGARVTSEAARANFADVLKGMSYTPEELREFNGGNDTPLPGEEESRTPTTTPAPADQSPDAPTPPASPDSPADGESSAPGSAPDSAPESSTPPAPPAKKARGTTKRAPARQSAPAPGPAPTESAESAPKEDPSPVGGSPATASAPVSDAGPTSVGDQGALIPTEAGAGSPSTPADAMAISSGSEGGQGGLGEGAVVNQLRSSLRALLEAKPRAEQSVIRAFLGQHYPGKTSADLDSDQLTKAINIVGGWPGSAETYPAPEPAPLPEPDF